MGSPARRVSSHAPATSAPYVACSGMPARTCAASAIQPSTIARPSHGVPGRASRSAAASAHGHHACEANTGKKTIAQ